MDHKHKHQQTNKHKHNTHCARNLIARVQEPIQVENLVHMSQLITVEYLHLSKLFHT